MAGRRRQPLRRLDLMILGASPEKLGLQKDIPAVQGPALSTEESERLYILNYKHQFGRKPLASEEAAERELLRVKLLNPRRS